MEDAAKLGNYLPLSYKTKSEQDYIAFLWDAFETNYTHGNYQFAFLAYHMLTMSFVYFNIWQIKQTEPKDFEKAMVGFNKDLEKELLKATSPFTFWRVNESNVMEILSNVVDCLSSGDDPRGYGSDGARRLNPIPHGHPIVELGSRSYQGHQMRSADFAPMPLGR